MSDFNLDWQEKAVYPYMPEQKVFWKSGNNQGTGRICGQASSFNAYPVLGTIWIVEPDELISGYSYRCIVVSSNDLTPLEDL